MAKKKKASGIGYVGEVTVKVLHGRKVVSTRKVHNKGTLALFNFLARCLANSYEERFAPKYLRTFSVQNIEELEDLSNIEPNDINSDALPFVTIDFDTEDGSVDFQFLVSSNLLNTDKDINLLALYSQDTFVTNLNNIRSPMAFVKLIDDDTITIEEGENLLIIWKLTIENVGDFDEIESN